MRFVITELAPLDTTGVLPLALAKQQLRVTSTSEDALIGSYIDAALAWIERYCGISLTMRAWQVDASQFKIFDPFPIFPLVAVQSLTYLDVSGVQVTLSPTNYRQTASGLRPAPNTVWPDTPWIWQMWAEQPYALQNIVWDGVAPGVSITAQVTAGYSTVPPPIIQAALGLVSTFYQNREIVMVPEAAVVIPLGIEDMLRPYRRSWL